MKKEKIIWYDKHKGLHGNMLSKARKFCKLGCVKHIKDEWYQVKHIPGYNKTDYDTFVAHGKLYCNCQYFQKNKEKGLSCSHILAVRLFKEQDRI